MAFTLPDLPYDYDALEPHIDEQTMRIHHDKHHAGYTNKLNAALEGTKWADEPIEETLANLDALPDDKQTAVRNNGGGFLNHGIFWTTMSPSGGGEPTGELADAIDDEFGSFDAFKEQFSTAATGQFGSGWAWLALTPQGKLHVHGLPNQDSPAMHGDHPILGIDVWEHAYYLKYQNQRPNYVEAWWNVVNWDEADRRYREAKAKNA
jgi:Fe-Mn family superoxide dismutase